MQTPVFRALSRLCCGCVVWCRLVIGSSRLTQGEATTIGADVQNFTKARCSPATSLQPPHPENASIKEFSMMATVTGSQAIPMDQQTDHTTTPPISQADTNQSSATTEPSQIVSSDAAQQTNSEAITPVSPNSVTSSPANHQGRIKWSEWGLSKWFLEHWLALFIGVVLVTIYFIIGYLKSPDREWASIENEYKFCEAHPVRSKTRFPKDRANFSAAISQHHRVQGERIPSLEKV